MTGSRFGHTVAPDQGAGFVATRDGGFALLEPLTPQASNWLQANVGDDTTWLGESRVIEMRYFADLADAIIAAGFLFERNTPHGVITRTVRSCTICEYKSRTLFAVGIIYADHGLCLGILPRVFCAPKALQTAFPNARLIFEL